MSCCSCFGLCLPCPCAQLPPRRRTATARHHPTTLLAPPTRLSNQPASQIHAHAAAVRRPNSLLEYHRPPWREPPAPCRLGILHQDSHLLVVDKPAGLQVGAGQGRAGQGLQPGVQAAYLCRAVAGLPLSLLQCQAGLACWERQL